MIFECSHNPRSSFSSTLILGYPHELMRILQRVAKPSKAALRQSLDIDLEIGPKHLGVETWLNLYVKILGKAKCMDEPPRDATYFNRHT
jgi:hypothetical protein